MIHTVIFDVGGTLVGAPDLFLELSDVFPQSITNLEVYEKLRRVFMNEYLAIGNGLMEFDTIENIIHKTLKITSNEFGCEDKSIHARECYYNTFVSKSYLYDDTLSTLEYLRKKNIKLIIASDADEEILQDELKMYKLHKYFDKFYISSAVKAYKPSDKFVDALKCGVSGALDGVIIVGDSRGDMITGKKLSVKTVLKGEIVDKEIIPDYSINTLQELINIIVQEA